MEENFERKSYWHRVSSYSFYKVIGPKMKYFFSIGYFINNDYCTLRLFECIDSEQVIRKIYRDKGEGYATFYMKLYGLV